MGNDRTEVDEGNIFGISRESELCDTPIPDSLVLRDVNEPENTLEMVLSASGSEDGDEVSIGGDNGAGRPLELQVGDEDSGTTYSSYNVLFLSHWIPKYIEGHRYTVVDPSGAEIRLNVTLFPAYKGNNDDLIAAQKNRPYDLLISTTSKGEVNDEEEKGTITQIARTPGKKTRTPIVHKGGQVYLIVDQDVYEIADELDDTSVRSSQHGELLLPRATIPGSSDITLNLLEIILDNVLGYHQEYINILPSTE